MRLFAFLLAAAIVLSLPVLIAWFKGWADDQDRERSGGDDPRARSLRKNHADMARLVERILTDEMVFPIIPEPLRKRGRDLLDSYYEDGGMH